MWKALLRAGEQVGRGRVERLMRANGIQGAKRRGKPWRTTYPNVGAYRPADLVERDFSREPAGRALVCGLHLPALLGRRRLLRLRDRRLQPCDRRLAVRRAHAHRPRPRRAADGARSTRAGADVALVHHSDAGSQYTSIDYTQTLDDHGVLASIGTVGDAYDNASAETFVDSFKTELIRDRVWRTRTQLELAVVEYVAWFNTERLHTSLGGVPPAEFEQQHARR